MPSDTVSWTDDLHKFCDTHIQEIKYFAYGLGVVGFGLIVKDLHLATTFRHVTQIPTKFITSHVTLQGRVQRVCDLGVLHVLHKPVFTLPFSKWVSKLRSSPPGEGTLPVSLVGVEMQPPAVEWLSSQVPEKHVWFQLLHTADGSVVCSVHMKKNFLLKKNLSLTLVQQGLAPISESGLPPPLPTDPMTLKLFDGLRAAELKARKQRIGIWKETEEKVELAKPSVLRRMLGWMGRKVKAKFRRNKQ